MFVCDDTLSDEYPGLPDMKQIGPQTQPAAVMDASNLTGAAEMCQILSDLRSPVLFQRGKDVKTDELVYHLQTMD